MLRTKPARVAILLASLLYALVFPIGGMLFSWLWLHWVIASVLTFLGTLFWPIFLYDTFKRPEHEPIFTGQIDHAGGGIGVAIGLVHCIRLNQRGSTLSATLCLILLVPALAIVFSLLSESASYIIQQWRWDREQRG